MARSNPKALTIFVTSIQLYDSAPVQALIKKGHTVIEPKSILSDQLYECDVVIGERCWRIDPKLKLGDDSTEDESLERQLEMMEKGVRAIKYPKEKPDANTTKNSSN